MKAIISTGGKQYVVAKGDELAIELVTDQKSLTFEPLAVIDDQGSHLGAPTVSGATVKADIVTAKQLAGKVTSIRYKAKKRVHKVRGHRQGQTVIKITSISLK